MPLFRDKVELGYVADSLLFQSAEDTLEIEVIDSVSNEPVIKDSNQIKLTKIEQPDTETKIAEPEVRKEENEPKEKEVIAFSEPKAVTLEQAYKLFNNGVTFIDARDEGDFLAGHISNSINIPFDDFDNHKQKLDQLSKDKPMVIYCGGTDCDLSHLLANLLFEKGYKQVYVFFGGWYDWLDAKYPVDYPKE